MKIFFNLLLILLSINSFCQENSSFRYDVDYLPADFYKSNRAEVRSQMPDSSVAILFSAPVRNRSNDTDFPYHQNPNFYYLTGYTRENSLLLIFKSPVNISGIATDEILFIPQRNKTKETWTGRMATVADAKKITAANTILFTSDFDSLNIKSGDFKKVLYLNLPSGLVNSKSDTTDLYDLVESFKRKFSYPSDNGDSFLLGKMLSRMREVKKPEELVLARKAISISCEAHSEMMKATKPGMYEYEVEAVGEYVFQNKGAEAVGYNSICGGGENSCILHYESNRRQLGNNDLILLDMGAEYHGYTADVTRTLPASGKFSKEQKIIYELVYDAQAAAFAQCKPGSEFTDPHKAAVGVIKKGLLKLKIISDEENFKTYFMHGTSHYLGLDVHDAGTREKLKAGNMITVEPGVYIPANSDCDPKWWNIGVRIEDDVLITENGYENLSKACPSKVADIEKLMQVPPSFIIQTK